MIEAYFDEKRNVIIKGKIRGLYKTKEIKMLVDSGFSADLVLPLPIACEIGLKHQGVGAVRLANGAISSVSIFFGAIDLEGTTPRECTIFVLPEIKESLIGMGILSFYEVCFHGAKNKVEIKSLSEEPHILQLSETLRSIVPRG